MSRIRRFEDLEVWKLSVECADLIYDLTSKGDFARDFALRNQVRDAGVSIFSNIAEGFERDGNREFANFLSISKGSCGEARAQLFFALRRDYITADEFRNAKDKLTAASQQLSNFRSYLLNSELKGRKWNR